MRERGLVGKSLLEGTDVQSVEKSVFCCEGKMFLVLLVAS